MKRMPVSRVHWAAYYQKRWCRMHAPSAEHLALWYLLLDLADGEAA